MSRIGGARPAGPAGADDGPRTATPREALATQSQPPPSPRAADYINRSADRQYGFHQAVM